MKRFWLVMLSLGLIIAFSSTAMAVDVKLSGEFYAGGMYLDKTNLTKSTTGGSPSTAFYFQRLRARTDFTITPGLKLITRFDAMERAWGATRSATGTALAVDSAGTVAENENIAIDWVYIDYKSAIGTFLVGYMNYGSTGTIFANSSAPQARIRFNRMFGPINVWASISKVKENSKTAINPVPPATAAFTDADNDVYHLEGIYNWKSGRVGLNINYYNTAADRTNAANPFRRNYFLFTPYVIAKFGPVNVQAELNYAGLGKDKYEAPSTREDRDIDSWSGWIDATANFGMFYAGGSIAYVQGDADSNDNKINNITNGGYDWNPCLIMFNYYDRAKWAGNLTGYGTSTDNGRMENAWFFQLRGGVKPVEKLDVMASVSYAFADKKPWNTAGNPATEYLNDDYGWEVDLTATYKITNNLSYMVGAGYLFTGKYYQANVNVNNDLTDDFLVINKLTLTF